MTFALWAGSHLYGTYGLCYLAGHCKDMGLGAGMRTMTNISESNPGKKRPCFGKVPQIGSPLARVDAPARAAGTEKYTADSYAPDMLLRLALYG